MRLISGIFIWLLRLVLFAAFFLFALHNRHLVEIYDWLGNPMQVGMAVALGLAALLGMMLGFMMPLPRMWRYRQERNICREQLRSSAQRGRGLGNVEHTVQDGSDGR